MEETLLGMMFLCLYRFSSSSLVFTESRMVDSQSYPLEIGCKILILQEFEIFGNK